MKCIFAITLLLSSEIASAAYIVESEPGVVTGIGNLEINGGLYNVDFEAGDDAFSTFGGDEYFWSSGDEALAAANAINEVLVSSDIQQLNNPYNFDPFPEAPALYSVYMGPGYMTVDGGCYVANDPCWSSEVIEHVISFEGLYFTLDYDDFSEFAGTSWSVATVPIPAAAWLFGSALIGLVLFKGKKA